MFTSAPLTLDDYHALSLRNNTAQYGEEVGAVRTQQEMAALTDTFEKSLYTSGVTPSDQSTGGDALKDHTLAARLAITERRMETEAPLWTELKKVPHPYDRVEFATLDNFGGDDFGGSINTMMADGGLKAQEPTFGRVVTPMGWYGGLGMNTLLLQAQRTVGFKGTSASNSDDTLQLSNMNNLVLNLDRATLWNDHSVSPFQANGLIKQTRARHSKARPTRINLEGQPLTKELAQHIEAIFREKGAMWKRAWMTGYSRADFETQFLDAVRIGSGERFTSGISTEEFIIRKWNGAEGSAAFKTNNHLRARQLPLVASPYAPLAPATVVLTQAANPGLNVWEENLPAGPVTYIVVARGINGRALGFSAGTINVVAGNSVDIAVTINDLSVVEYEIFAARNVTGKGAGYIGSKGAIAPGAAIAAVGTVLHLEDDGEFVPGCDTAFFMGNGTLEDGQDEVQIMQQFPITKIELPRQLIALPFAYVASMTPIDYTPGYNLIFENMGRTTF